MPLTRLGSIRQKRVMDLDELRDDIWGYLFEHKTSKSIEELATLANRDAPTIRSAVNHEWFAVSNDCVSIAYVNPSVR
jgi:hypothetical protein